jgi:hypothetical protein
VASQVGSGGYLDDADAVGGQEYMWSATALWANLLLQARISDADAVNRNLTAQLDPGGDLRRYFETGPAYISFFEGDYGAALEGLESAERLMPDAPMPVRLTTPSDPRATNRAHLAYVLGVRCRFPESRALLAAGQAFAETLPFPMGPFSVCYVRSMRASIEVMAGDLVAAGEHIDALLALADRHGFTFWTVVGGFYDAFRALRRGEDGADQRCAMALMLLQGVGVHVWLPYFHCSVGAALLVAGEPGGVAAQVAAGRAIADAHGAHYWSPELARVEGAALLALGDPAGEAKVREAVDRAVAQGATLHELWARTTLVEHTGDEVDRAGLAALVDRVADGAPPADVAAARAALG